MAEEPAIVDGASTVATKDELQARSRDVSWYVKELSNIPEAAREVLEKYSNIPSEQVHDHIYKVRENAWDVWPFPCLGSFRFLDLNLRTMPQYSEMLSRLQKGEMLLDLGCCFGQELRRLVFDGAPADNLYGTDLRPEFFDLGYDLFLDRGKLSTKFIAADVFAQPDELMALRGKFSVIYTGAFFHLFDRPQQLQAAKVVAQLLKPEAGSMVLGRQVGSITPGVYEHGTNISDRMFRHDEQSWKELWQEVGEEMGVRWDVEVELRDNYRRQVQNFGLGDESVRQLRFCVRRL